MNKRNKSVLVLIYCLFMISLFIVNVNSNQNNLNPKTSALGDIEYNFQENILYNKTNPNYDFAYNTRNQTVYTEIYNGTYSFTNEIGLNGTDISFVDLLTYPDDDDIITIIKEMDGHNEVLKNYDEGIDTRSSFYNIFEPKTNCSIEFWFYRNQTVGTSWFYFQGEGGWVISMPVYSNYIDYGGNIASFSPFIWYHFRFDFFYTYFDFYINGIKNVGSPFSYGLGNYGTGILKFYTESVVSNDIFDAIGYSWDTDYNINDNIIPYRFDNETLEVDKLTFKYYADGTTPSIQNSDIPLWDETSGYPYTDISGSDDISVRFLPDSTLHETIKKEFTEVSGIIELNFKSYFTIHPLTGDEIHYFDYNVYSYDDTLQARIRISGSDTLDVEYYTGSSYVKIYENFHSLLPEYLYFNLTFSNNIVVFNSDIIGNILFPSLEPTKKGLGKIEIDVYASGSDGSCAELYLDWVAVYVKGISVSDDFSEGIIEGVSWNLAEYVIIEINATGECSITYTNDLNNTYSILSLRNYIYFQTYTYDFIVGSNSVNGTLNILFRNDIIINYLKISQFYLLQDSNKYYPVINRSGIDSNESYFYVNNNELKYVLRVNDSNLEYMLITFDIDDIVAFNKTFTYTSNRNTVLLSELRLGYTDYTTSIIDIVYGYRTEKMSLPIDKELDYFQILVTDNDLYDNKNGTGSFSSFILRGSGTYEMDITTINLLEALSPLLFFIIFPALLIAYFLQKSPKDDLSKKLLVPLLMIFSLVAFGFGSIPLWSLFLLIVAFASLFLIVDDEADN